MRRMLLVKRKILRTITTGIQMSANKRKDSSKNLKKLEKSSSVVVSLTGEKKMSEISRARKVKDKKISTPRRVTRR